MRELAGRGARAGGWNVLRALGPAALALGLLAISAFPTGARAGSGTGVRAGASGDTAEIHVTDVFVPVRGGVRLHGRLWRPVPRSASRPTILTMTPYTVDDAHEYGRYFARNGYAYLNVDVRGRGASEGEFWPLADEGTDGRDVVEWVAAQHWSDGRVATRGGSYRGMVQWQILAAGDGPPAALKTAVPTASAYPGWDFPNPNGIFLSYAVRWLAFVQGNASQGSLFGDSRYWESKYRRMHRRGKAFRELDEIAGISSRVFDRWIRHPWYDEYWRRMNPAPADYRRMDLPLLTISGHFDGDQPGALRYYREHVRNAPDSAARRHYLVMGPWSHGGTRSPSSELRGLTFADTAAIDVDALHLQWFDRVLRDGEKPEFLRDRVVYYVMGAGKWRSARSLDAVSDTVRRWHLSSPGGGARDVFRSGRLSASRPEAADVDRFTYDPRDTADVATRESFEEDYTAPGAAFLDDPKLVYHSPPLRESLEVSGRMRLEAWIELDVPDVDLQAWVYEVRPDGTTIYLGESELRGRHRRGVDRSVPVEPGRVERWTFDRFYWFARRLRRGSRLRLVIVPLNTAERQKNYHSGAPPMGESREDARTATVKLHSGPERPSRLILPVRTGG